MTQDFIILDKKYEMRCFLTADEQERHMKYYLAPMEGITNYIYRRTYHQFFAPADKYFTPFINPHTTRSLNSKEKKDILPENNQDMYTVPQILTNQAEDFGKLLQLLNTKARTLHMASILFRVQLTRLQTIPRLLLFLSRM